MHVQNVKSSQDTLSDLLSGNVEPAGPVGRYLLASLRNSYQELRDAEHAAAVANEQYLRASEQASNVRARVQFLGEELVREERDSIFKQKSAGADDETVVEHRGPE